jgi:hypothetical protein
VSKIDDLNTIVTKLAFSVGPSPDVSKPDMWRRIGKLVIHMLEEQREGIKQELLEEFDDESEDEGNSEDYSCMLIDGIIFVKWDYIMNAINKVCSSEENP